MYALNLSEQDYTFCPPPCNSLRDNEPSAGTPEELPPNTKNRS